jgi:hypothetical protein
MSKRFFENYTMYNGKVFLDEKKVKTISDRAKEEDSF